MISILQTLSLIHIFHECGRFEQENLSSLERSLGYEAISLILKMNIGRFSKSVQYHKSLALIHILILVRETYWDREIYSLSIVHIVLSL